MAVVVVDYDPSWPDTFAALRAPIWEAVRDIALGVEHVGSTSVRGLAAKPVIDMDVIVRSRSNIPPAIERLAVLGYEHRGDLGIQDREAFQSPPGLPKHHLYLCVQGCAAVENHLTIRDCLRRDPAAAAQYGLLKRQLAEQFPTDIDRYVSGKTEFLLGVLRAAGFSDSELSSIRTANQA